MNSSNSLASFSGSFIVTVLIVISRDYLFIYLSMDLSRIELESLDCQKVDSSGIEPEPHPCHGRILPLNHEPDIFGRKFLYLRKYLYLFKFLSLELPISPNHLFMLPIPLTQ